MCGTGTSPVLKILMVCVGEWRLLNLYKKKSQASFVNYRWTASLFLPHAGNSCRSPMAESVIRSIMSQQNPQLNWYVDSAALADWNVGYSPEPRCIAVLGENGLTSDHIARQVKCDLTRLSNVWTEHPADFQITDEDFERFDYIFGMDDMNIKYLERLQPPGTKAKVEYLGKYDFGQSNIIEDPYFVSLHRDRSCLQYSLIECSMCFAGWWYWGLSNSLRSNRSKLSQFRPAHFAKGLR